MLLLPRSGPSDASGQPAVTQLVWKEPGCPRRAAKEKEFGKRLQRGIVLISFGLASLRTGTAQGVMERPWGTKAKSTRNNHVSLRSPKLRNMAMEQLLLRARQSELLSAEISGVACPAALPAHSVNRSHTKAMPTVCSKQVSDPPASYNHITQQEKIIL